LRHASTIWQCAALAGVLIALCPATLYAQESDLGGFGRVIQSLRTLKIPVQISADEMNYVRDEDRLLAAGHIRVTQGAMSLTADQASFYRSTGRLLVNGAFDLQDGEDRVQGDALDIDLKTQTGVITRGHMFLPKDHYHVVGEHIERFPDSPGSPGFRYRLDHAIITTCDSDTSKGERPTWSVRARRLTVRPEQYLTASDVVFAIEDIPVFYFPYLVWPVKTERQTGLLQPRLGYSTSEGFKINQPFYLTLGPSQDATLTLDERTQRGFGGTLEYRYRLSRRSAGQVEVEVFNDKDTQTFRGRAATTQTIFFNDRLQLRLDGEYVSDDTFLSDLSTVTADRTRRTIESNVFLTYHDAYQTATLLTRYTQDLTQSVNSAVQLLPELTYRLPSLQVWNTALYASLQGSADNFWQRSASTATSVGTTQVAASCSRDGAPAACRIQRLDLFPVLLWRYEAPRGFIVTPRLGVRETLYSDDGLGEGSVTRQLGVAALGVSNQGRREWMGGSGSTLIHAVEPGVLYSYVGDPHQEAHPRFDEIDDIVESNLLTATLTNRLLVRGPDAREIEAVWVRLTQSYHLTRHVDSLSGLTPPRWSMLRGEATVRPIDKLKLDVDVLYDYQDDPRRFPVVDADVLYTASRFWDLSFGHRSTRQQSIDHPLPRRGDFLDPLALGGLVTEDHARVDYDIVGAHVYLPWGVTLANKAYYNRKTNAFSEIDYGLQYRAQCWGFTLTYQDFPEKNELGFVLTLVGPSSSDSRSKKVPGLFDRFSQ